MRAYVDWRLHLKYNEANKLLGSFWGVPLRPEHRFKETGYGH